MLVGYWTPGNEFLLPESYDLIMQKLLHHFSQGGEGIDGRKCSSFATARTESSALMSLYKFSVSSFSRGTAKLEQPWITGRG